VLGILRWLVSEHGATVVSAYATAIGVLIALGFGLRAERRSASEHQRLASEEHRLANEERKGQASLVYAWLEPHEGSRTTQLGTPENVLLVIHNGSPGLIYDVYFSPTFPEVETTGIPVIGLGTLRTVVDGSVGEPYSVPFSLRFTDGRGVTWLRAPDGRLTDLGEGYGSKPISTFVRTGWYAKAE
jgi:hypothetical protein